MSSTVIVEIRPDRSVARPALIALAALAVVVAIWLVLALTRSPATVPRLTIANPSAVAVEIDVSPSSDAGTLGLGHLNPGTSHTYRDVLDQGSRWIFHVSSARGRLGELDVSRDDLEQSDWTIRLPAELSDQSTR